MNFMDAVDVVIDLEGERSNDPLDPGGLTKYGISSTWYPQVKEADFDKNKAIKIYYTDFWTKFRCDKMPSGVDLIVFDSSVNQTQQTTVMIQQSVCVRADGILGPITMQAIVDFSVYEFINEFAARRSFAYSISRLLSHDGLGWFRRLQRVASIAHKEAASYGVSL